MFKKIFFFKVKILFVLRITIKYLKYWKISIYSFQICTSNLVHGVTIYLKIIRSLLFLYPTNHIPPFQKLQIFSVWKIKTQMKVLSSSLFSALVFRFSTLLHLSETINVFSGFWNSRYLLSVERIETCRFLSLRQL